MSGIDPKLMASALPPQARGASSSAGFAVAVAEPGVLPGSLPSASSPARSRTQASRGGLWPYVQIARVDHWFKNAFMMLGTILALFYQPALFAWSSVLPFVVAVAATCLVAS